MLLYSDLFFFGMIATLLFFVVKFFKHQRFQYVFNYVLSNRLSMISLMIFGIYMGLGILDSIHFQLPSALNEGYDNKVKSVLDLMVAPWDDVYEKTYSMPFSKFSYVKETIEVENKLVRTYPRLEYGAAHLNHDASIIQDVLKKLGYSFIVSLLFCSSLWICCVLWLCLIKSISIRMLVAQIIFNQTKIPVRLIVVMSFIIIFIGYSFFHLSQYYHIFGTDKIGQDIFFQSIKSIRTALIIGTLTTLVMLPFAVILGTLAGLYGGKVDDIIQYLYTTLSSIPGVLLIAASILSIQVFISAHESYFPTLVERADLRLLALCFILGMTSWTSLCRLIRAETLKIRELDYIAAAKALGTSRFKMITRHILPNINHILIISIVLDFSALVLAEAVLSYVGVGVSPITQSWGNMINSARLELAREPVVWWPITSAFIFMFILVLSVNLFADTLRDALDPRHKKNE